MEKLYRVYSGIAGSMPHFLWLTPAGVAFWRREGFYVTEAK